MSGNERKLGKTLRKICLALLIFNVFVFGDLAFMIKIVLGLKFVTSFCDICDTWCPAIMVDRIDIILLA